MDVFKLQELCDDPDPHATLPFISHHTLNISRDLEDEDKSKFGLGLQYRRDFVGGFCSEQSSRVKPKPTILSLLTQVPPSPSLSSRTPRA
jgi:hypothetical protein